MKRILVNVGMHSFFGLVTSTKKYFYFERAPCKSHFYSKQVSKVSSLWYTTEFCFT